MNRSIKCANRFFLATILYVVTLFPAHIGAQPTSNFEDYLFQVVKDPVYARTWNALLAGHEGIPAWVRNFGAAHSPGQSARVGQNILIFYDACESGNCPAMRFSVAFTVDGTKAWAVFGPPKNPSALRFLGTPDTEIRDALRSQADYSLCEKYTCIATPERKWANRGAITGAARPHEIATANRNVERLYGEGQLRPALELADGTLNRAQSALGEKHLESLKSLSQYALLLKALGRDYEAVGSYGKLIELRRGVLGEKHPETLAAVNDYADSLRVIGMSFDAQLHYDHAATRSKEALDAKQADTITWLRIYAVALQGTRGANEARPHFERLLRLRTEALGDKHPNTLVALFDTAFALGMEGHAAEAAQRFERVAKLRIQVLGEKHPDTLVALYFYANALRTVGQVASTLPYYERVIQLSGEMAGDQHPVLRHALGNYAGALEELGHLEDAFEIRNRNLALNIKVLGENHPNTVIALNAYISSLLGIGGITEETLKLSMGAIAQNAKVFGETHPTSYLAIHNYIAALMALGRTSEALPLQERALTIAVQEWGEKYDTTITARGNYAYLLNLAGRSADAVSHFEQVIRIDDESGIRNPNTIRRRAHYAHALTVLGRKADALHQYESVVSGIELQRDEAGRDTAESQRRLFGSFLPYYHDYLLLLKDMGRASEALTMLERTRARTLIDQMALRAAIAGSGLPDSDINKLTEYFNRIGALDTRIALADTEIERKSLSSERSATSRALADLKRDLQARYPRFRQITEVQLATSEDASHLLSSDSVYVSFVVIRQNIVKALVLNFKGEVSWVDITEMPGLADTVEALRMWSANQTGGAMVDDTGRSIQILRWMEDKMPRWRVVVSGQACHSEKKQLLKEPDQFITGGVWPTRGIDRPSSGIAGADCIPSGAAFVSNEAQYRELVDYLGNALLTPLQGRLAHKRQVIISPDGPLGLVPWDILPINGKPLIAQFDVSQVQSLSVLKLLKARQMEYGKAKARADLFAMGNPEYGSGKPAAERGKVLTMARSPFPTRAGVNFAEMLRNLQWADVPGTQVEMDRAAGIFAGSSRVVSGKAASETKLRRLSSAGELANYRYLLFAAHGYFDPNYPSYSSLEVC